VDVDLVVLQATVRDREGHTVMQLGKQNFDEQRCPGSKGN